MLIDIEIPLGDTHGTNLDFAEAQPVEISGFVYHDRNNNGIKESGEEGIGGVDIQIVSITTIGSPVTRTVRTNADGSYELVGLPPGVYRVVQTQPSGYIDGKDSLGRVNGQSRGAASNDVFSDIRLDGNDSGETTISVSCFPRLFREQFIMMPTTMALSNRAK